MRILDKNRTRYKKTFSDEGKCIFCNKKDPLECTGLSGRHWRVIVNRFPYMDGNVMLIPARHIEKVEDVRDEEWQEFGAVLAKTQSVLGQIFETNSFNVGLNVGPQSGASIPHLHWQVVPRKMKNITAMNTFADLYIVAVTPEMTKKMISNFIKKAKK